MVFSNQKGGVGKTTCCRELGIFLAERDYDTLLIDADPQGNLSRSLTDIPGNGLYDALSGFEYEEARLITPVFENLSLLGGGVKLAGLEKALIGELDAFTRLRDLLEEERFTDYAFILIDSPPSLGVLTGNALTASNHLIIPMNPSLYSMQGTNDLMVTVSKVRKNFNPGLNLLGVIINAYEGSQRSGLRSGPVISRQIHDEIRESFGDKVFQASLSKSIRVEEAIALKAGVIDRPKVNGKVNRVAGELESIGLELLNRLGL